MRIDKLTKAQAARSGKWSRKWIEIGLSTEPADFDAATEAALKGYALANLKRPMVVLRMGSPYAATVGGALAWLYLKALFKDKVESQVRSQVASQVASQVWSQVESQVWSQVESQVWSQVWSQVESQVRSQVASQVGSQVGSQVWSQVWSQVESQVESQVGSQVASQVESQVGSQVWSQVMFAKDGISNYGINALWSSWGAYISFFRDVCGWKNPILERFEMDEALIKSCGWTWWHQNVLAISDRPNFINRDDQGRLHNERGSSISYRDGWALHHWHGVFIEPWIIEQPERITPALIESEKNAEVRRVMVERYGEARYISDSGLKPIAQDSFGKLFRKDFNGDTPLVYVKVMNSTLEPDGSIKPYFLSVNPQYYDGAAGTVPHAAVASTWRTAKDGKELFFKRYEEYKPGVET